MDKYPKKIWNLEYMHVKWGKCKLKVSKGEKQTKDLLIKMDTRVSKKKWAKNKKLQICFKVTSLQLKKS